MRKDDGLLDGASGTGREIDRRTIAKGVAWTVPVVIVATAAPAAAASGDVHVQPAATAGGQNGRTMTFTFDSHLAVAGTVSITGVSDSSDWTSTTAGPTAIGARPATAQLTLQRKNNKASSTTTVTFSFTPQGGQARTLSGPVVIPAT
jgi:hypothetical protein